MNTYVAGLLGLAGVLCVLAGVHGKGAQLFTAVTGQPLAGTKIHLAKPGGPAAKPSAAPAAPSVGLPA